MGAVITAALDGVAAASVAVLSVLGVLLVFYAAMWGARKVLAHITDIGPRGTAPPGGW